ncbi:MAG: alpha-glucan family phosphorylase [Pirellulaceae bacterium]|nr:alpha-glucan family phosphorylase [Pirellulaceae bacterium]
MSNAKKLHEKCLAIARNLWWSWQHDVFNLFRELDPIRWRELEHNPIALLGEFTPERLEERVTELSLISRIDYAHRRLRDYMECSHTWGKTHAGVLGAHPVAYFSAEFGIHESLPIYSGGLGVLSGDHIKSASGLGVPLVAVGLFYSQGYFHQRLDEVGYQQEDYANTDVRSLPMQSAYDEEGKPLVVKIETEGNPLFAKIWYMQVGRVRLYLLDCDVEENSEEDRRLTSRLYGGDERTRIRQELVLGIGGIRALRALGIRPGVYHLNEGHSAFAPLEVIREYMEERGLDFQQALSEVARRTVFTTHTPVPAGHDRFSPEQIAEHLAPQQQLLGISFEELLSLGRVDPGNPHEMFCMTVLGLKLSRRANAVSNLHGHVSRKMWQSLWPHRTEEEIPIGHITNGVHVPTWMAGQMRQLCDRHFPADWIKKRGEPEVWKHIHEVRPGELWETHNSLKSQLINFVRHYLRKQARRRGEEVSQVEAVNHLLDPNILTIGFARRFATYKRAALFLSDIERMQEILNNVNRPVQFIFSGKAHPKDEPGKQFIQKIVNTRHDKGFNDRIVFVEDYDINVGRHLVHGVDVWLNNPRRPLEASGTSGQKVTLNGGLNCSILDGWWAEAYDGTNGFAIGHGAGHADESYTDKKDAENLYRVLEDEVIPCFYDRDSDGLPQRWIEMMKNSMSSCAWRFSAYRMLMDYTKECYEPSAGGVSCEMP